MDELDELEAPEAVKVEPDDVCHPPTDEKPEMGDAQSFICRQCGCVLSNASLYIQHSLSHIGIRVLSCGLCDRLFHTLEQLAVHTLTHRIPSAYPSVTLQHPIVPNAHSTLAFADPTMTTERDSERAHNMSSAAPSVSEVAHPSSTVLPTSKPQAKRSRSGQRRTPKAHRTKTPAGKGRQRRGRQGKATGHPSNEGTDGAHSLSYPVVFDGIVMTPNDCSSDMSVVKAPSSPTMREDTPIRSLDTPMTPQDTHTMPLDTPTNSPDTPTEDPLHIPTDEAPDTPQDSEKGKTTDPLHTPTEEAALDAESKRHKCDKCGKSFAKLTQYKRHRDIHEGRKFMCEECGKMFSQKGYLKSHRAIHTDAKLFACETCGREFTQRATLIHHMAVHDGKKFKCEDCGKIFSRKSYLSYHAKTHQEADMQKYACKECPRVFAHRGDLTQHVKSVHQGIKFGCEVCGKEFTKRSNLTKHAKTH